MVAYRLLIKPSAGKELSRLGSTSDQQRVVSCITALADDPKPNAAEKLAGYDDRFRIRQGSHRVAYLIDDRRREVTVLKIGDRKDV